MTRASFRLIVMGAALLASASLAGAQTKVAVVNLQRAVLETADIKKAQADLEARYRPQQQEMEKLQKEVEALSQQLQTMRGKLTQQGEQDLVVQGQRKQRELQRLTEDLQGEVNRDREEILARVSQQMSEVVGKLATQKDLDIVVDVTNTVFFKPALDLTKEAVAAYDAAHPVK
ncbi:MAG TPA: OmpH family outer membrane protein [Bryobacteraceae bacterium]|nr:OmpH family outer membrane protein [Bryobacteraceae bacterium]